ncbi:TIGR03905 family TSCPD domain-containing protein [Clostridium sp. CX1]|uniref:TIGR03905 family TSCPD domain-containing protein n=1 Tax=Clostridium sp. CX1 TaxID=2978346 RepID=UPI0021C0AC54|nr:TIGR03905 family TSCPD domain-containing protein [Clostridium sp. CX1]MCT8977318.1 TIGR03905 family TSCPD domain-containing protein [Clostridium sp. CX1]
MYIFSTNGVCSKEINFDVVDNKISNVRFLGGCDGNLQGLSRLLEGMEVDDAIERLKGISCGGKSTSCPDQFAAALEKLVSNK